MQNEYYILVDNEKTGPFTYREVIDKRPDPDTRIAIGAAAWQYASELPELIEYFATKGIYFPTGDNLANFGIRALAFIIDYLILSVPLDFIFIKLGIIAIPRDFQNFTLPTTEVILQLQAWFSAIFLVYHTLFEVSPWRGSIGKKICGLAIVDIEGQTPKLVHTLGRNLGALMSLTLFYGLSFLSMLFIQHRQTWYDYLAKTYTIKTN